MNYQYWHGFPDRKFGYGSMFHGFIDHLPKSVTLDEKASVNLYMGVPFSIKGWHEGQHRALFTMWETDQLPAPFQRWLPQYDQIIVPCQHNVELFSQHHDNVVAVPLGVDTKFWTPRSEPKTGVFRFHAGGSLWRRKGLDLVVDAFSKLRLPNAELHIKAAPHAKDVPTSKPPPNVYLHRQWMTAEQQRDWFHQADCYVAPARGEGWGLMPLQAITAGIPTILSLSSGQKEFADLAAYTIPCGKSQAETIGRWDEPNIKELAEAMRHVYNHRDTARLQAREKAKQANRYTWAKASKALLAALPTGTLLTNPKFVRPNVTMKIKVRRTVRADIGNHRYNLDPGVEYTVPENVHQVLFDSGALEGQ